MAQQIFQLPLTNVPQVFQLPLKDRNYLMTCKFNDSDDGGWVVDFADADSGESIIAGIPLVTGTDLFSGLEYLNFGGSLIVYTDGDETAVPTFTDLGVESNLYFITDDGNG